MWFQLGCHLLGALASIHAIIKVRTSQGAIAWAISLNTIPLLAVPAYLVFGRSNFFGYRLLRKRKAAELTEEGQSLARALQEFRIPPKQEPAGAQLLERLAKLPATRGNHTEVLIDGEATFKAIFEGIDAATSYVLVQFYILKDDGLGRRLKERLIARAKAGARCYVLYDEIGSHSLSGAFVEELQGAGVEIQPFNTRRGPYNRFQLNFRNHRKVVICDGHTAFVGGHNVGDEYLGLDPKFGAWRDTHVKVEGPVVQCVQVAWLEDWLWATGKRPDLNWIPRRGANGADGLAFCLPSGPADSYETCTLFFLHAINAATKRIWIASPYFVPDEQFISALQLAALRGVDIRILVPKKNDNLLVHLSGFTFFAVLGEAGVRLYSYVEGFMHQKTLIVDDYCGVGTANFDNRSFRLNFEITMLFAEPSALREMEAMFAADFARSEPIDTTSFATRPWWQRFAARVARLLAPVQ